MLTTPLDRKTFSVATSLIILGAILLLILLSNFTVLGLPAYLFVFGVIIGLIAGAIIVKFPPIGLYFIAIWNPLQYIFTRNLGLLPEWSIWLEDFVVYLLFGLGLLRVARRGGRFPKTRIEVWLLIFISIALFSALLNQVKPVYVIAGIRSQIQFILFFFSIVLLEFKERELKRFFILSSILVLIQTPVIIYQFFQFGIGRYEPDIAFGTFALGYANIVGYYILIFTFLFLGLGLQKIRYSRMYILFAVISLIGLVLTSSRAAIFLLILGVIPLLGRRLLSKKVIGMSVLVLLSTSLIIGFYYQNRLGTALHDLSPKTLLSEQLDNIRSPGRLRYLIITAELIEKNPATLLFGYGPGEYASTAGSGLRAPLLVKVTQNSYSPNIQSELAAVVGEYGLLGTLILFIIYFVVLQLNFKNSHHVQDGYWRGIGSGMRAVSVIFIVGVLTERIWEIQPLPYYLWFFTAALFNIVRSQKRMIHG